MIFKVGQQVNFFKNGTFIDGYIYGIHARVYQIGYWDKISMTEKIDTNVNESQIQYKICPFTNKECIVVSTNVNICNRCEYNKYRR